MDATKRRMKILDMFQSQNTLKISFISKKLNVSRETIRGDLSVLQDQGKVTLIRGGAILIVSKDETPYEKRWLIITDKLVCKSEKVPQRHIQATESAILYAKKE